MTKKSSVCKNDTLGVKEQKQTLLIEVHPFHLRFNKLHYMYIVFRNYNCCCRIDK